MRFTDPNDSPARLALSAFCAALVCCVSLGCYLGVSRDATPKTSQYLASPVKIEVRGNQFAWSFRYPGSDGELGTSDDLQCDKLLRLPPGVDVELALESDDYIYLLSCPDLGLKEIAVPEMTHTLNFQTSQVGSYDLLVDPLCGWRFLHDDLMGRIMVQPALEFDAWYKQNDRP